MRNFRRMLALLLSFIMVCSSVSLTAAAEGNSLADEGSIYKIGKIAEGSQIVIDAKSDEEAWDMALSRQLQADDFTNIGSTATTPVPFESGEIKFLWSDRGLYFYVLYNDATENNRLDMANIAYSDNVGLWIYPSAEAVFGEQLYVRLVPVLADGKPHIVQFQKMEDLAGSEISASFMENGSAYQMEGFIPTSAFSEIGVNFSENTELFIYTSVLDGKIHDNGGTVYTEYVDSASAPWLDGYNAKKYVLSMESGEIPVEPEIPPERIFEQEEFIISSFQVLPDGWTKENTEILKTYQEAGFNLLETMMPTEPGGSAWTSMSPENNEDLLAECEKIGLKVLLVDAALTAQAPLNKEKALEAINRYKDSEALYGYYLWDEPSEGIFKTLSRTTTFMEENDPGRLPFSVILPSYGPYSWEPGATEGYTEYVDSYLEIVNPPVLSVDYYPFAQAAPGGFMEGYWSDLGYVSQKAVENDIPFWMYIQSCGWAGMSSPTLDQIRFQAYMPLVYGAQGLQYFVFSNVNTAGVYEFKDALVDQQGNKLPNYDGVASINKEILTLGPTLMQLERKGVYHQSKKEYPFTEPASQIEFIEKAIDGTVIGLFTDTEKNNYIFVANTSYEDSVDSAMVFAEDFNIEEISKETGLPVSVVENGKTLPVQLLPGEGRLYRISEVEEDTDHGSSGNVTRYQIEVADAENGTVRVSSTRSAAGNNITVTLKPDEGYRWDGVTVTDAKGNEVKVTDRENGQYTFKMPRSNVTVQAYFAPEEIESTFTDVHPSDWYFDAVEYAAENGLMNGTSATTFSPNTATTRGMLVTILYRLEDTPAVTGGGDFTDVAADQYYADAVAWAVDNGIVSGYGNGLFGPGNSITRQQMAAILYRYAQYKGEDVSGKADLSVYADAAEVDGYAEEAMAWAVAEGLINGTSSDTLSPDGAASRAQVAAILQRFLTAQK